MYILMDSDKGLGWDHEGEKLDQDQGGWGRGTWIQMC